MSYDDKETMRGSDPHGECRREIENLTRQLTARDDIMWVDLALEWARCHKITHRLNLMHLHDLSKRIRAALAESEPCLSDCVGVWHAKRCSNRGPFDTDSRNYEEPTR